MKTIAFPMEYGNTSYEVACTSVEDPSDNKDVHFFIRVYKEKIKGAFFRSYHLRYFNNRFKSDTIEYYKDQQLLLAIQEKLSNFISSF